MRSKKPKRSLRQSKYRFFVIELLRDEFRKKGFVYTKEQMNDLLKYQTGFYIERVKTPFGDEMIRYLNTNYYSPAVFEEWMQAVREFGDSINLTIPLPNEVPISAYN